MAALDKLPIELIWVLVNTGNPQINALLNVATVMLKARISQAELSVNRNAANTQALIKIAASETGFRTGLSAAARGAIVRVYIEADHAEVLALVTDPTWAPVEGP
jgi:hypothetical protein